MRIIGGKYKHKRIDVPRTFKARPTTDFAKESLFNILTNVYVDFDESLTALDLFGGTGSIGIEFVSRGCSNVVSVEKDYKHYQFLIKTARELNDSAWKPVHADVFKFIQRCPTKFNIVFADSSCSFTAASSSPCSTANSINSPRDNLFSSFSVIFNTF